MQGFFDALMIARATADGISGAAMPTLRREMAAEALLAFADEARAALDLKIPISAPYLSLHNFMQTPLRASTQRSGEDQRTRAASLGYVGEACPECANFTLVRNGTCMKRDTCGSTTGCS